MKNYNFNFKKLLTIILKIICLFSSLYSTNSYSSSIKENMQNKLNSKEETKTNFLKLLLTKTNFGLKLQTTLKTNTYSRMKMTSMKSLFAKLNSSSNSQVNSEKLFQDFPKATVDLKNTADIGKGPIYFQNIQNTE